MTACSQQTHHHDHAERTVSQSLSLRSRASRRGTVPTNWAVRGQDGTDHTPCTTEGTDSRPARHSPTSSASHELARIKWRKSAQLDKALTACTVRPQWLQLASRGLADISWNQRSPPHPSSHSAGRPALMLA